MSITGPCPDTSTHLSWKLLNICKGLWESTTCSGAIWRERERSHDGNNDVTADVIQAAFNPGSCLCSTCLSYLDVQQVRQLLGLVLSLTASCIGDENHRKPEVVVPVHQIPKSSSGGRNHRAATEQDAVNVKEDSHLRRTDG